MKKLIVILIAATTAISAKAQHVFLSPGVEKTVQSYRYGASLHVENKKKWGFGVFYQAGLNFNETENDATLVDPFYGVLLQAPIAKSDKISFLMNLRGGMVNEKFLVVVPGLETRLQLLPKLGAVFGMGIRSGYPSMSVKLIVPVF